MNLLPVPRSVEVGDGSAPWREPDERRDLELPSQGYELRVRPGGIGLVAADDAGAFYGRATLAQLRRVHGDTLPVCTIRDSPDLPVRGVMLDVSRDKVPTLETVEQLIDRLASWKVNHVQLYIEHTFAYANHRAVWEHSSPFTADELRELDGYCRARHVELVPNQNCLGHMQRWLRHDRYRTLAVAPDGWRIGGRLLRPTTIDPNKAESVTLVRELLAELLVNFTSRRVHVGLDEPWELPEDRIGDFIGWVHTLRALPELAGREMLVWGDILAGRRELIEQLPAGVTVCEWGYDDWYPFDARAATLEAADQPFWVCPGTSSWLSILGRVTNMRADCANAAEAAVAHGGIGFLNTDWGDKGHLQYLPISEPGFAYGAAVSWCHDTNRDLDLAAALSAHAFDDPTGELATALLEVGDAHLLITPQWPNQSMLVMHLYYPQSRLGDGFTNGLRIEELIGVEEALEAASARVDRARPRRADGSLVIDELRNAIALVRVLGHDAISRLRVDGDLPSIPDARRADLATELRPIIDEHRRLWLARNRVGGLADSVAWLEHLLRCYELGGVDDEWGDS